MMSIRKYYLRTMYSESFRMGLCLIESIICKQRPEFLSKHKMVSISQQTLSSDWVHHLQLISWLDDSKESYFVASSIEQEWGCIESTMIFTFFLVNKSIYSCFSKKHDFSISHFFSSIIVVSVCNTP